MKFVNPYNFIPFGEDIEKNKKTKQDKYRNHEPLKSGWIEVTLHTKTPLIIPDGAHPKYYNCIEQNYVENPDDSQKKSLHKEFGFMKRNIDSEKKEEYYIPGSSIRGMIRSVYEAATDSCVPFLLNDHPISQRIPLYAALKKRGLLAYEKGENGKYVWRLYKASAEFQEVKVEKIKKTINVKGRNKIIDCYDFYLCDGSKDKITLSTGSYVKNKDAYIQYNVPVNISEPYHIAYLKKGKLVHTWNDNEPYEALKSVLCRDGVKGNQNNPNYTPSKDLKKKLDEAYNRKENLVPVYYFTVTRKTENGEQTLVYLSNSASGRIAQRRKWKDIMGDHVPCKQSDLCPACLLFGNMAKEHGLKSKVRVTDALPLQELSFKEVTLGVLGEPRTSAFEFYLERPSYNGEKASYWNFDFFGVSEMDDNGVSHTEYYDLPSALPRGRKMYWHGKPVVSERKTRLNATVTAADEKQKFAFRVYYDEITEGQLQELIWTITLGDNLKDSNLQHKLGHAKPFGYGSVKLTVDKVVERTVQYDEDSGIKVALNEVDSMQQAKMENINLESKMVKSILKIADASITKEMFVKYPFKENKKGEEVIYMWFSKNRVNAKKIKILPDILNDKITNE